MNAGDCLIVFERTPERLPPINCLVMNPLAFCYHYMTFRLHQSMDGDLIRDSFSSDVAVLMDEGVRYPDFTMNLPNPATVTLCSRTWMMKIFQMSMNMRLQRTLGHFDSLCPMRSGSVSLCP